MKKISRIAAVLCAIVLGASLAACGESSSSSTAATSAKSEAAAPAAETKTESTATAADGLKFAGDIVGQGVGALDIIVSEEEYTFNAMGSSFQIYNDNFTADTQTTNIQTMASSGYAGMMVFGWNATFYNTISETAAKTKTPFVFFDQIPTDDAVIESLNGNEYYVGSVGVDNYVAGENAAKAMLEDGITTALILGGSVGDVVHDARVNGFTAAFEAGGGKIAGVARCSDPSEATSKEDDLISGNADAQATYALTGDYAISAIAALDNHSGTEMAIYCSDTTAEAIPYIIDGTITYGDGGSKIATTIAATLLQNYATGNIIRDADGNAPRFSNIVAFRITPENAEKYSELFLTGHPLTEEAIQGLVGIDYDAYEEWIEGFSWEYIASLY